MNLKKTLLLTVILLTSFIAGSILIWQGLNLDRNDQNAQVLGKRTNTDLIGATASANLPTGDRFLVTKVIDGDTFYVKLDGDTVSVRMVGIDTPETVDPRRPVGCFGKKSSDETKRLIEGKEVILTKDISDTDKYNRLLRYVFLPVSGGETLFINDYLIRQGFAKSLTYPPDVKYNERFVGAERDARDNLRGLWSECQN